MYVHVHKGILETTAKQVSVLSYIKTKTRSHRISENQFKGSFNTLQYQNSIRNRLYDCTFQQMTHKPVEIVLDCFLIFILFLFVYNRVQNTKYKCIGTLDINTWSAIVDYTKKDNHIILLVCEECISIVSCPFINVYFELNFDPNNKSQFQIKQRQRFTWYKTVTVQPPPLAQQTLKILTKFRL